MTSKEYIISKLESFITSFPQARVRYEHDADIDTHFVEILPNELYHLKEDYMDWEEQVFDDFVEMFPGESIGFITDDALVGLENVEYELRGTLFDKIYTTSRDIVTVCEDIMTVKRSVIPYSTIMNQFLSQVTKAIHIEDRFDCTYTVSDDTFLLV